jgi:Ca-activated chloride channel homolog
MRVFAVLAALLLAAAAGRPAPQPPTFSSRIEAVRVDVLVTEKGHPARGLRAADFEVTDNGVPQRVDLIAFERLPLNLILAVDVSSSVAGERLDDLRNAGSLVLQGLRPGDQAALVAFSHRVGLRAPLTPDVGRVQAAVSKVVGLGDTALVDGAYAALMLAESDPARALVIVFSESDPARALVIVFSDGVDTSSWLTPPAVLDTARASASVVYGIAAGQVRIPFLRDLCRQTGGTLYEVESTAKLGEVFVGVLEEFRQRYLISYSPTGVEREGWHALEVRVRGRNAVVKARPGYLVGPSESSTTTSPMPRAFSPGSTAARSPTTATVMRAVSRR